MKIVQVAGSAQWAGGERQLLDLMGALDPSRFAFEVICPEPGPLVERLAERGVSARVVPLAPLINPAAASRLARALRDSRPDCVQSHGARSNFYARLACRREGLRHIATVHNDLAAYPVGALKRRLYGALDRWSSRWSETVVCVSESLRRGQLAEGVEASRIKVIRNGVDTKVFDPEKARPSALRSAWGGGDAALVGLVGRMTEQKGHAVLLEALERLKPRGARVKAVFVGDGPLRGELERRAGAPGLAGSVVFAGVRSDMPDVLAALDLVALPSLSEGLPYVLLEALAMERPVVASAVDGVLEVVPADRRGARLVPPRDPEALAAAVEELLAGPAAASRMAREGLERVRSDFSLDAMARRWEELYLAPDARERR